MRDFTKPAKLFISAERTQFDAETNARLHQELGNSIKASGHRAIECEGVYEGVREKSYIVFSPRLEIYDLARQYDQDTVLHVDHEDTATLVRLSDGKIVGAGKLAQVSADKAEGVDHTRVDTGENVYHYIVEWSLNPAEAAIA